MPPQAMDCYSLPARRSFSEGWAVSGGESGVNAPLPANAVRLAAGCMAESGSRLPQSKAFGISQPISSHDRPRNLRRRDLTGKQHHKGEAELDGGARAARGEEITIQLDAATGDSG